MEADPHYHEELLHWLWQKRYLKNIKINTCAGKEVLIHHPGYPNTSDGPDFTNARITIGSLKWHGDVEIHWSSKDWQKHAHHKDANYNRVILHVIYDDAAPVVVKCVDGSSPPTLCMKKYLPEPLQYFFHHFQRYDRLACSGNICSVPEAVFTEQFEEAHQQYFEQKVDDLLQFYDSTLPLSTSWLHTLIIAIFDVLGISHNREPMIKLGKMLLEAGDFSTKNEMVQYALKSAGIEAEKSSARFNWKRKGSRPANHPENRIKQGCEMMHFILHKPFKQWLKKPIKKSFKEMTDQIDATPGLGSHQAGVLYGTVWIPAFYLLGDLAGTRRLRSEAREAWAAHRTKLPKSITNHFHQANIPPATFQKKLGAVHQYRRYCKPRQCQQCRVFNHIISA